MVDFGEELVIVDSYRIPWLIWIQMLVFVLLLILLYALGIFSPDLSDHDSSSSSSAVAASTSGMSVHRIFLPGDPARANRGSKFFVNSSLVQSNQSIKGEITPSATGRVVRGENTGEGEGCSSTTTTPTRNLHHPCNLFQLAGSAFLKCLGLDRTKAEDARRPESKKQR